jgi:DNA-nicking Smr family endonuclease
MSQRKRSPDTSFHNPFKDLKKLIKKRNSKTKVRTPEKPATPSDEKIFMDAMKEVREIQEFREIPLDAGKRSVKNWVKGSLDTEAVTALEEIVNGTRPVRISDTPEYVEWINRDYRNTVASMLHKGHYAVQDSLDLHGIILEDAETEIDRFIRESLKKNYRCIKIIHGRGLGSAGRPVLKEAVVKLLSRKYKKHIVAFVSARQCDGGLGASYVLLKWPASECSGDGGKDSTWNLIKTYRPLW